MAIPVEMPKLGNTVEECLLAKWLRTTGARVAEGDILAEIETDKATFELPAPAAGVLIETFFEPGALIPVFTNVCVIGEPGENVDEFRPRPGAPKETAASPAVVADRSAPITPAATPASAGEETPLSPRARRFAEEHGFDPAGVRGSGPGGRVLESDLRDLYFTSPRRSPLARRHIAEGYEAPAIGSGVHGMIRAVDLTRPGVPLTGIRDKIARRMRDSLASTAQYTMNASASAAGLLALRARIKASGAARGLPDINVNDLVLFCTVQALLRMPQLNAELRDGKIYQHAHIHLGFACDTDRGLLVPVVKDCENLTLPQLAIRVKALTEQAVAGSVALDDLGGATFTVSNLGSLGIESFTPLINPPQVAILGVDAIQLRPVRTGGAIEFVEHIGLSLTCDHQVIDGAPGARFLQVVRDCIERVDSLANLNW